MGARGPIPKRSDQRLGHVTKAEKAAVTQVTVVGSVEVPPADESWHQIAKDWYRSLAESGQAQHYEPSDWQAARLLAHELTRALRQKVSATLFSALWTAMGDLLTTEGERRRVKMEINRKPPKPEGDAAKVTRLDDYRNL